MEPKTVSEIESGHRYFDPKHQNNRSFGFVFSLFFYLVAFSPFFLGKQVRFWAIPIGTIFFLLALFIPRSLSPLNHIWTRLGLVLNAMISPFVLAILFYGCIFPFGKISKILGGKFLEVAYDKSSSTYWVKREPEEPDPKTMAQQF